ncbi:MAG: peptidoglycan DD-metalloendopeptidase family protein [Candidatus Paceibacterota bacterium]
MDIIKSEKLLYSLFFLSVASCLAGNIDLKLPYEKGESFLITQSYDIFTHKNNDLYALDFALNGCEIFDKPVESVGDGVIVKMEDWHNEDEDFGYGNIVVIEHPENLFSIYAHLHTVFVKTGDSIRQGDKIATVGATGFCKGTACPNHPGAHLHFAMYKQERYIDANGREQTRKVAYKPEPMSGFIDFVAGKYYKSDNGSYVDRATDNTTIENGDININIAVSGARNLIDIIYNGEDHNQFTLGNSPGFLLSGFRINQNGDVVRVEGNVNSSSIFSSDEKKTEISFDEKYDAKLVLTEIMGVKSVGADTVILEPNQEALIKAKYKNVGVFDWQKKNVSINILSSAMSIFYDGWLTRKRPVSVLQNVVSSDASGDFVFRIKAPEQEGSYVFGARPVVFYENDFHWLGEGQIFWNIRVEKEQQLEVGGSSELPYSEGHISGEIDNMNNSDEAEGGSDLTGEMVTEEKRVFWGSGGSQSVENDVEDIIDLETFLVDFPESITSESCSSFSFRSNFEDANFECKIDDNDFEDCVSPRVYENLGEGSHFFEVKALLSDKEDSTPARHIFAIDRSGPAKIEDLNAVSLIKGEIILSGTLLEDNFSKLKIYYQKLEEADETWTILEIPFDDETNLRKLENNRFETIVKNLDADENYNFGVKTEDLFGNISAISNLIKISVSDLTNHLLISEFKLWGENKFIELYNPTQKDLDLSEYSLQFLNDDENKTLKVDFKDNDVILSHGFFLVSEIDFNEEIYPDMIFSNLTLGNNFSLYLVGTKSLLLNMDDGIMELDTRKIIDEVKVIANENSDNSLERKAHQSSISDLILVSPHKYDGNGFDSDAMNDFLFRQNPEAQNSESLAEPHNNYYDGRQFYVIFDDFICRTGTCLVL